MQLAGRVEKPRAKSEGHGATGAALEGLRALPPPLFRASWRKNTQSDVTSLTGKTFQECGNVTHCLEPWVRGFSEEREAIQGFFWSALNLWRIQQFPRRYFGAFNIRLVERIYRNLSACDSSRIFPDQHQFCERARQFDITARTARTNAPRIGQGCHPGFHDRQDSHPLFPGGFRNQLLDPVAKPGVLGVRP